MFRNYMVTALRNLLRHKQYTLINVFGLAAGLAACLLILLYVSFELSYDQWIPEKDRVYKAETRFYNQAGEYGGAGDTIPPVASPLFAEQLPEIELFARFLNTGIALATEGRAFEQSVTMTDPDIFELMGVTLLEGDMATALSSPDSLVLSITDAKRIFGDRSPLGQVVKVDGKHFLKVTGVMPDWPKASDLEVHALVPITTPILSHAPWATTEWGSFWGPTYYRVRAGTDPEALGNAMNELAIRIGPSGPFQDRIDRGIHVEQEYFLTKAEAAHFRGDQSGRGSMANLWTAGLIAALILAIAVINVANLGTMLAMKRVREVAIRKALGAEGRHLMVQVMVEAGSLAVLSMLIGIALAEALLPVFSNLMNRELTSATIYSGEMLLALVLGTLLVGAICGLYPALVAMRFRPVDYLSGIKPRLGSYFRNGLIVLQFAATIGLMVMCLVVFMQARYVQTKDQGFKTSQLLAINGIERPVVMAREVALREALGRIPGVEMVAASHSMVGTDYTNNNGVTPADGELRVLRRFAVSENLLPLLGVKPIAGRLFSKDHPADLVTDPGKGASQGIILNDLAVKKLGYASPEAAIGQEVRTWGDFRSTIIGVIPNLRMRSARQEASATYYWAGPHEYRHQIIRISPENIPATLAAIDQVWKEFFADIPIRRQFVDEAFAEYYDNDRRQGWLLLMSAGVMTVIAVMGLYGLAGLATERRSKEIGIRKVLGAKSLNIVRLLLWQFSLPVLVANLIAWPLAWWGLSRWLESFIDRIGLTPLPFLVAGLLVLGVAWITIIGHTLRVARRSPIQALRYE